MKSFRFRISVDALLLTSAVEVDGRSFEPGDFAVTDGVSTWFVAYDAFLDRYRPSGPAGKQLLKRAAALRRGDPAQAGLFTEPGAEIARPGGSRELEHGEAA